MKYYVDDLRLGLGNPVPSGNYRLDMVSRTFRNWTIAFNVPLTETVAGLIMFLREHGAEVVVTSPMETMLTDEQRELAARLACDGLKVYVSDDLEKQFSLRTSIWKQIAEMQPHLVIDTNYQLSSNFAALSPIGFESLSAVLETNMQVAPPFIVDEDLAIASELTAIVGVEPHTVFPAIDTVILNWKRLKGGVFTYDYSSNSLISLEV